MSYTIRSRQNGKKLWWGHEGCWVDTKAHSRTFETRGLADEKLADIQTIASPVRMAARVAITTE